MSHVAIFGAGAFGTALAIALARDGRLVKLWARDADHLAEMARTRRNDRRLPGAEFPESLELVASAEQAADGADALLLAVPTQKFSAFLAELETVFAGRRLVACCKGVDLATGLGPAATIAAACPEATPAILTGPSFAVDIARGLPTALTLAIADPKAAEELQALLSCQTIRIYRTDDVTGAELGGALKNVIALAAGLTIGAGLGESARAAVVTRGFAEMQRFAATRGARPETLAGLSGLGDLVLTCTSEKSRNFSAGLALGSGRTLDPKVTTEGVATAKAVSNLAEKAGIDLPITRMVAAVLDNRVTVAEAADLLLSRPLKKE